MHGTLEFFAGVMDMWWLPGLVFAENWLPFPATPFLLAAGALPRRGHLSFWFAWPSLRWAAVLADGLWFQLGRRR